MVESWKLYKIKNRITGEEKEIGAKSAQEACWKLGWMVGGCYVQEIGKQLAMELQAWKSKF